MEQISIPMERIAHVFVLKLNDTHGHPTVWRMNASSQLTCTEMFICHLKLVQVSVMFIMMTIYTCYKIGDLH